MNKETENQESKDQCNINSVSKRLDVNDKVAIIANCDEVTLAVKMLIGLMEDAELKNYVEIDYEVLGQKYKLNLKGLVMFANIKIKIVEE